jgi:O-antigen ligase
MREGIRIYPIFLFFSLIFTLSLCFFYYKYVPFIKNFQIILAPILIVILIATSIKIRWGILIFVFIFPLINNLPYFFGIDGSVPHAPAALVLFLFFFLGWLLNNSFSYSELNFNHRIFKPLTLFSLIILTSGIITFFRYANFFPFLSDNIQELIVNVSGVRTGGAIMSDVFSCLNYLTGFIFFVILFNNVKSIEFLKKLLIILSVAILISLFFSLVQKYYSVRLGNTSFWVQLDRINSTFKDPNSFGVILSSFFLLLTGMILSFRKKIKFFFLFIIALGLFIFPATGSRSGFLGLGVSVITFFILFLLSSRESFKKRLIYASSFFLIVLLLCFSFLIFSKQSNLYKRIGWSLDVFTEKESLNNIFTRKFDFWAVASHMIHDYPLTGIGIGAFIVELSNYSSQMGLPVWYTDSAENYFFQIGSEMGLIGLFVIFWLFSEVFKTMRRSWKKIPSDNKNKFILIGAISGIVSLFVNFFFHSYIGAFDVKYFFWLLIAVVFIYSKNNGTPEIHYKLNRKFSLIAIIVCLTYGLVYLWNSSHSLSLDNEAKKYGWNQNFGFYQQERDDRGIYFKWTKKQAGISVENVGSVLVIPFMASHPDIGKKPVKIRIYLSNSRFKKEKLEEEINLDKSEWINFEYSTPDVAKEKIYLVFEANRDWQPLKYSGVPDPRWIAIAIGNVWFKSSYKSLDGKITKIQKVPYKNWQGEQGEKLWANGVSRIKFNVTQRNIALRLHIRGQKAFDLGPHIVVRIDGQVICRTLITEEGWTYLVFAPEISEGEHELSVQFINDFRNVKLSQDRNVFLGDLEIMYTKQK